MRIGVVVLLTTISVLLSACQQDRGKVDFSHLPDNFSNHSNYYQYKGWTHNKVFMMGDRGLGAHRGVEPTLRDAFDSAYRYCRKKNVTGCTVYDANDVPLTTGIPAEDALKDFAAFEEKIERMVAERGRDILQNADGRLLNTEELAAFLPDRFFIARTADGAEMAMQFSGDGNVTVLNHATGHWAARDNTLCLNIAGSFLPAACLTGLWKEDQLAFFHSGGDAAFRLLLQDDDGNNLNPANQEDATRTSKNRGMPFLANTGLTIAPMLDMLENVRVLPQNNPGKADRLWMDGKAEAALKLYAREAAALESNQNADLMVRSRSMFIHGWRRMETGDTDAFIREINKSLALLENVSESSGPVLHIRGRARRSIYRSLLAIGLVRQGQFTDAEQAIAIASDDNDIFQRGIKNTGPYAMFLRSAEIDAGRRFSASTLAQAKGELALARGEISDAEGQFLAALSTLGDPSTFGDLKEVSATQLRERSRDLRRQYALLLSRTGKHGLALAQLQNALETSLKLGGINHPETGASLITAARILLQADRPGLAHELLDSRESWPVHGPRRDILKAISLLGQQPDADMLADAGALALRHIQPDRPAAISLSLYKQAPDAPTRQAALAHAQDRQTVFGPDHPQTLLARFMAAIVTGNASAPGDLHRLVNHTDIRAGIVNWSLEDRIQFIALLDHFPTGTDKGEAALDILKLQQLAIQDPAQEVFAKIAIQQSTDDPARASLLRQEQDLALQLAALNGLNTNQKTDPAIAAQLQNLTREYGILAATLKTEVPNWQSDGTGIGFTLSDLTAVTQNTDQVLISHAGPSRHYSWLITGSGQLHMATAQTGAAQIADLVRRIRRPMNQPLQRIRQLAEFDQDAAHSLWKILFAELPGLHKGNHLAVITGRPLDRLPLDLLLTRPSVGGQIGDKNTVMDRYAALSWMIRDHAVWQAPGLSALLHSTDSNAPARRSFLAFADPVFAPGANNPAAAGASRGLATRALPTSAGAARGLSSLPALPDTGREVSLIANHFGNDQSDLFLQAKASEASIRDLDRKGLLRGYETISFATHGLVAGDLPGLTMPALALSAPTETVAGTGSGNYDGLLTMEEIFGLDLDSDLVVLSACNSAANDGRGGSALTGLGRAFFHAGSRSMLASHWAVHSAATADLMVAMLDKQPTFAAQSLARSRQQAILQLMDAGGLKLEDGRILSYSHPLFWAPFTLYSFQP